MSGTLYGIGVGPGEGELLTIKAKKIIETSDAIILPNKNKENCIAYEIVKKVIPEIQTKELIFSDFPMTKDSELLQKAQKECAEKIEALLIHNKHVSFLTIGDPTVYSTYMYVHNLIEEKGYDVKIINGIPSFCAVAAKLGIPLGSSDDQIHIIPGNYNIEESVNLKGTLVFMKSGRKLSELKNYLLSIKENYDFDFYSVSNCGLTNETICKNLQDLNTESGYLTIVIIKNLTEKNIKHYKFFQNTKCEMFPCHKIEHVENFNCLFCYCPLYYLGENCGGNFKYTEKGIKSCVNCNIPHQKENYDLMIEKIKKARG